MCANRRRQPVHANRSGVHVLRNSRIIDSIIDASGVAEGGLVFDLGAGPGTFTAPLADTGARVLAVERDPYFVRMLERRFLPYENVRIVDADVMEIPFPGRPFQVVASIPFALSTPLLRRLLGARHSNLRRGDLVVEWGFAKRLLDARTPEIQRWQRRFEFEIASRVNARHFAPQPRVDCAHLTITRR